MKFVSIKESGTDSYVKAYELVFNHGTQLGLYLIPCNDPYGCPVLQVCVNDKNNQKKDFFDGNVWFNLPQDFNINKCLKVFSTNTTQTFNVGDKISMRISKSKIIHGTVISNSLKNSNKVAIEWDDTPIGMSPVSSEDITDLTLI